MNEASTWVQRGLSIEIDGGIHAPGSTGEELRISHRELYRNKGQGDNAEHAVRRIVACVNACQGIKTDSIEADGPGGVRLVLADNIKTMQAMRDVLVACRRYLGVHGTDIALRDAVDETLAYAAARMPTKNSGNSRN